MITALRKLKPDMSMLRTLRGRWREHPSYRGAVGHWLLNERAGPTAYDLSRRGNRGTLTGPPTWVGGKFGSALQFAAASSHYVIAGDVISSGSAVSWSFWINPAALPSGYGVLDKYVTTGNQRSWRIHNGGGLDATTLTLQISSTGSDFESGATGSDVLATNTWSHVVMTFNNGVFNTYRNGVFLSTSTFTLTSIFDNTSDLHIGRRQAGIVYLDGMLDDIRIYSRVLLPREISALYHDPFLPFRWAYEQKDRRYFDLAAAIAGGPHVGSLSLVGAGR